MALNRYHRFYDGIRAFLRQYKEAILISLAVVLVTSAYFSGIKEGEGRDYRNYSIVKAGCAGGKLEYRDYPMEQKVKWFCVYDR